MDFALFRMGRPFSRDLRGSFIVLPVPNELRTVGFIGLGVMGRLMAANLEAAGFAVQSFDINKKGNRKSARAAAQGADVLITMLPDGDTVREAVLDALPGLKAG